MNELYLFNYIYYNNHYFWFLYEHFVHKRVVIEIFILYLQVVIRLVFIDVSTLH